MNEGRIWTVVKPTIGVPIFLGAVMITSLIIHFAVLNNTTWFPRFLQGSAPRAVATSVAPVTAPVVAPAAATPTAPASTTP